MTIFRHRRKHQKQNKTNISTPRKICRKRKDGIYNEYLPTPQETSGEHNSQENLQGKDDEEEEKDRLTGEMKSVESQRTEQTPRTVQSAVDVRSEWSGGEGSEEEKSAGEEGEKSEKETRRENQKGRKKRGQSRAKKKKKEQRK